MTVEWSCVDCLCNPPIEMYNIFSNTEKLLGGLNHVDVF
jgi:hypothetical protein